MMMKRVVFGLAFASTIFAFGHAVLASGELEDGVEPYGPEAEAIVSHVEPGRPLPKHFAASSDAIGGVPELRAAFQRALRTLPRDVVRDNPFLRVDLQRKPDSLTSGSPITAYRVRGRDLYYGEFHQRHDAPHFAGFAYAPANRRLVLVTCLAPRVGGIAGSWYAGGVVLEDDLDFVILRLHVGADYRPHSAAFASRLAGIRNDSRCWHRSAEH